MRNQDKVLIEDEDTQTDRRRWHTSKEIPVALILTMVGIFLTTLASTIAGYMTTMNRLENLEKTQAEANTNYALLAKEHREYNVPMALVTARVAMIEASVAEIKARVSELERRHEKR